MNEKLKNLIIGQINKFHSDIVPEFELFAYDNMAAKYLTYFLEVIIRDRTSYNVTPLLKFKYLIDLTPSSIETPISLVGVQDYKCYSLLKTFCLDEKDYLNVYLEWARSYEWSKELFDKVYKYYFDLFYTINRPRMNVSVTNLSHYFGNNYQVSSRTYQFME